MTNNDPEPEPRAQEVEGSEMRDVEENLDQGEEETIQDEEDPGQASDDDIFAEFRWMEQMDGTVFLHHPDSSNKPSGVGYCNAKLIRRNFMRSFYSDLEQPTQETCNLAFQLFDRYGRLKKAFKEHVVKKGSGIWGDEFDSGDLLLFEEVSLQAPYRLQGLGTKLVEAILERARSKSNDFFAVVTPGWLNRVVSMETNGMSDSEVREVESRHQVAAECFYRSVGFRRVGSSSWLAFAGNPEHPCHSLDAAADFDMPVPPPHLLSPQQTAMLRECSGKNDKDFLVYLQGKMGDRYNPLWDAIDKAGNTILYCSAMASKNQTTSWILNMRADLRVLRNDEGETVLDALLDDCETKRTQRQHNIATLSVSDEFKGFPDTTVACVALLKGMSTVNISEKLRLKFGCTCGSCIGGFLSPRMRFSLRNKAKYIHDMLQMCMSSQMTGDLDDFLYSAEDYLLYVPESVRNNMRTNRSLRQGFANLFTHFEQLSKVDTSRGLLNEPNVLLQLEMEGEWPPHSKNYLKRGGTIYAVGSCLFEFAMNEDEVTGDGDPNMFDEDEKKEFEKSPEGVKLKTELAGLSECRNDLEYGFVSAQLGYKMVSREYYHTDEVSTSQGRSLNTIRQASLLPGSPFAPSANWG